jgi:hypothetical protein
MSRVRKSSSAAPRGLAVSTAHRFSFFDVPIYRVSQDQFDAEFERFIEKQSEGMDQKVVAKQKEYLEQNRQEDGLRRDRMLHSFGGPWQFNEIVGHIRLHFLGNQVRGTLWMIDKKRVNRTRKKQFSVLTHKVVAELGIPRRATNQEVYETILKYLNSARKKLRRRFVDTRVFERIGRFVDWNAMREENSLGRPKSMPFWRRLVARQPPGFS